MILSRLLPLALAFVAVASPGAARATAQDTEPLTVVIQYPRPGAVVVAPDSSFVFGRVEGADPENVRVTVNGTDVAIHASGGWLAYVPVAPDSFAFDVRATSGSRTGAASVTVWVPPPEGAPGDPAIGYRPGTIVPSVPLEAYAGDTVRVRVVAAPNQNVTVRLGSEETRLLPDYGSAGHAGRNVFGDLSVAGVRDENRRDAWVPYVGDVYLRLTGVETDTLFLDFRRPDESVRSVTMTTVRLLDPTDVRVAILDDDTAGTGHTDGRVVARAAPGAGYTMLLPNGTMAALGRRSGGQQEIILGGGRTAWVAAGETIAVSAPRPTSSVPVIRTRSREGWSELVVPLSARLPFRIEQALDPVRYTISIFGATTDTDWVRYTTEDPVFESIRWRQAGPEVYQIEIDLRQDQPWGFAPRWEGTQLVIGFRHPPERDRRFRSALHGARIVIDPGHNPDPGSVGPTGFEERQANLEISLVLAAILERRGAQVVLTRASADSALGLYDRPSIAMRADGDLFVSIHNNALPDGVNPLVNNGTSTFFYHPQSRPLAAAIQRQLVAATGLPDYGMSEGNLAVLRMNEMPAVLVEGAFMMIPEQEALLRTPAFQERIATAVADGIERFLEDSNP